MKGNNKVLILYKDSSYELKKFHKVFNFDKTILDKIERLYIPMTSSDYPVYIPILPNEVLFYNHFEVELSLNVIRMYLDDEELESGAELRNYKEFDNVLDFLEYLYILNKTYIFNDIFEAINAESGYYNMPDLIYPSDIKIRAYDNGILKIDYVCEDAKVLTYEDILDTNGYFRDYLIIDTVNELYEKVLWQIEDKFGIISSASEEITYILNKNKWEAASPNSKYKDIVYDDKIALCRISSYSAMMLMSKDDYEAISNIEEFSFSIIFINRDEEIFAGLSKPSLVDKSSLLEGLDSCELGCFDYNALASGATAIMTIAIFISDIINYIRFVNELDIDAHLVAIQLTDRDKDRQSLILIDEEITPAIFLHNIINRENWRY